MQKADLSQAHLDDADLRMVNLTYAKLQGTYLSGGDLRGANLRFAFCEHAIFDYSNLGGANLGDAYLREAYFDRANLAGAILESADIGEAEFYGATGLRSDQVKGAWNWPLANYTYSDSATHEDTALGNPGEEKRLLGELGLPFDHKARVRAKDLHNYNLGRASFRDVDLSGFDLREANLEEAILYGVDLHGAVLMAANLKRANLGNQARGYSSLEGSDLENANLQSANLQDAQLTRVNLKNSRLDKTILYGADLISLTTKRLCIATVPFSSQILANQVEHCGEGTEEVVFLNMELQASFGHAQSMPRAS